MAKLGVLDFAGGTVVHLTAGLSALVCALFIGKRLGYGREKFIPHNLTMTITGAGLLWFGWFGFNAGSALAAGRSRRSPSSPPTSPPRPRRWPGCSSSGCTAASRRCSASSRAWSPAWSPSPRRRASSSPAAALVIGALAGLVCYGAVLLKERLSLRRLARRLRRARRGRHARRAAGRRVRAQGAQPGGRGRPARRRSVAALEAGGGAPRGRRLHAGGDARHPRSC